MNWSAFNKTTISVIVGALLTILTAFVDISGELQGAIQTVLVAIGVYLIPNIGNENERQ